MGSAVINERSISAIINYAFAGDTLRVIPVLRPAKVLDGKLFPLAVSLLSAEPAGGNKIKSLSVRSVQKRMDKRLFTLNAGAASTATDLNITNSSDMFQAGGLLYVPRSHEEIVVKTAPDADLSTNTPYLRGQGGSVAQALLTNDVLLYMGRLSDMQEEAPNAYHSNRTVRQWWACEPRDYVVESNWAGEIQANELGVQDRLEQQGIKFQMAMLDLENLTVFSRGSSDLSGVTALSGTADVRPGMTGVIDSILKYGEYYSDMEQFTFGDFENFQKGPAVWHHGDWMFLTSGKVMQIVNGWPSDYLHIANVDIGFGNQDLRYIENTYGKTYFTRQYYWTDGPLQELGILLPLPISDFLEYWTPSGGEADGSMKWYMNIKKDNRPQLVKDEFAYLRGLVNREPEKFGFLYNILG